MLRTKNSVFGKGEDCSDLSAKSQAKLVPKTGFLSVWTFIYAQIGEIDSLTCDFVDDTP